MGRKDAGRSAFGRGPTKNCSEDRTSEIAWLHLHTAVSTKAVPKSIASCVQFLLSIKPSSIETTVPDGRDLFREKYALQPDSAASFRSTNGVSLLQVHHGRKTEGLSILVKDVQNQTLTINWLT